MVAVESTTRTCGADWHTGLVALRWAAVFASLLVRTAGAQDAPPSTGAPAAATATAPSTNGSTNASTNDNPNPNNQRITVTGSAAQERREEVSGKQVVTAEELARHGDTRLADALRRVPGLSIGGTGAELQIRLDGLSAEQTLVLLNGEPVPRGQLLEALAVGMIERIEIVRGANVQWSGRGLAGTINIVTVRTARSAQRDGSLALGTYFGHTTGQAELNLGDKEGPRSWRLGVVARAEREHYPVDQQLRFTNAAGNTISAYRNRISESARDEALTLTPQVQWDQPDGTQLQLNAVLSAGQFVGAGDDFRTDTEGSLPRMQADRLAYRHQRAFVRLGAKGLWPLSADTRLSASVVASRGLREQDSVLTGSNFTGVQVRDSKVESTRTDDLLTGRADLQHRINAQHTLTTGLQLDGNRRQEDRVQRERIPSWEPDLTDERYDAASHSVAVFVQDDWLASKATTVSWGARVEQLNTRSVGNVFDGVRRNYRLASPMLNLLWRPDTQTQWKMGLSRAFRLPEPRDIMPRRWTRPENSSLVPDFIGNPELRPEAAWTLALGWDRRLGGDDKSTDKSPDNGGSVAVNATLKRVDDVILDELVVMDGAYLLRRANFGRAWVATLQAQWQGEWAARWGGPVKLRAVVGARASRLAALPGPDNRLAGQSPWDLRLEADHQPQGTRWQASASWRWRDKSLAQAPSGRLLGSGASQALDLSASWLQDANNRWRLSATGLFAPEEQETVVRTSAAGIDRFSANTQQAPRWRVQWLHKF